jgi:hypothetical protein
LYGFIHLALLCLYFNSVVMVFFSSNCISHFN